MSLELGMSLLTYCGKKVLAGFWSACLHIVMYTHIHTGTLQVQKPLNTLDPLD